jgi:hypothetical protein
MVVGTTSLVVLIKRQGSRQQASKVATWKLRLVLSLSCAVLKVGNLSESSHTNTCRTRSPYPHHHHPE